MIKILVFGDLPGVTQLVKHLPHKSLVGIVGATIRPQYLDDLKILANKLGVPFFEQPQWQSNAYAEFVKNIQSVSPDLIWANSYSMIIRDDVLLISRLGGLNIHSALLPKNQGCNPTQWAIINNENITGITLHAINSKIDSGDILDQTEVPIFFEDTWLDVSTRLSEATDLIIKKNIFNIINGKWSLTSQKTKLASYNRRRNAEDSLFSWEEPVVDIYNKIRALLPPLPPAFFYNENRKIVKCEEFQSIWQVTDEKYNPIKRRGRLIKENILLSPSTTYDKKIFSQFRLLDKKFYSKDIFDHSDLVTFVIQNFSTKNNLGLCKLFNIDWVEKHAELDIRIIETDKSFKYLFLSVVNLLSDYVFGDLKLNYVYFNKSNLSREIEILKEIGFGLQTDLSYKFQPSTKNDDEIMLLSNPGVDN